MTEAGDLQGRRSSSSAFQNYVLAVLLVIYICNQTDRSLFSFLMQPIKADLDLTDAQLGFLAGPALAVLYTILGIPVARWADRHNRVNVMFVALICWSAVTLAFAGVKTYGHLALAQLGVGIGEAGFTAIAMSVIADYYPEGPARMRALSTFTLGIPISGVVSGLLAGWVDQAYGWRAVFVAAGAPGLFLAVLLKCTVREPARHAQSAVAAGPNDHSSLREILKTIWRERSLRQLAFAACLANVVGCLSNWVPAFLVRSRGMDLGEVGVWNAVIAGGGGSLGIWLSGRLVKAQRSNMKRTSQLLATITAAVFPLFVVSIWCSWRYVSLIALVTTQAAMYFFLAPTLAMVQALTASNVRATTVSIFILIEVLAGAVLSTQLTGVLSDSLTPVFKDDARALQWSMTGVSALAIWAALHFWLAGRGEGDSVPRSLR